MAKVKRTKPKKESILIQHLDIRQIHRASTDIDKWRNAIQSAESILNPTRKELYDLYHEMLLDGRLKSVIDKRIDAIVNTPVVFSQDGKENEAITNLIETEEFDDLQKMIMESVFWGYSLIELSFRDDKIVPLLIDRRHVKPEKGIVTRTPYDIEGINYLEPPFDKYTLAIGKQKDLGLLLQACQYVIYKRGAFGDWAQFAELFGMPFRKGKYDGFDEGSRLKLETALKEAGSAAYAVIPEGTDIEFIQNQGNAGSNAVFKELRNACNEEITILILGQTLTTSQGEKGARSLGDVHKEVEDDKYRSDRNLHIKILNHKLLPLLKIHGYPVGDGRFSYPEVENLDKKTRLEMDITLSSKVPIDDDYFYKTYGVPKPANYEQLKKEKKEKAENTPPPDKGDPKNLLGRFLNLFS